VTQFDRLPRSSGLLYVAALTLLAFVLAGCGTRASSTASKTAGASLSAAEVRKVLDELPQETRDAVRHDTAALERIVRAELVRRAALEQARAARFDAESEVRDELDRARDDALVRLWVARQGQVSKDYPTEEDLRLAYAANQAGLATPSQFRVAQIFISAPNGIPADRLALAMRKAADVGARIPGGDFAALARDYSEHADSAARGGDVGLLPANRMLPEIVAAVNGISVGATVGPVKTSQGLHYVKLLERRDGAVPSFDEARPRLVAALRARRQQELEQAYLQQVGAGIALDPKVISLASAAAGATDAVAAR
jgi:peptidylprolyl isomerase